MEQGTNTFCIHLIADLDVLQLHLSSGQDMHNQPIDSVRASSLDKMNIPIILGMKRRPYPMYPSRKLCNRKKDINRSNIGK